MGKTKEKLPQVDLTSRKYRFLVLLSVVFVIVASDLVTKWLVFDAAGAEIVQGANGQTAVTFHDEITVIPGFFDLQCVVNPGAFSGWFSGMPWFLIAVSVIAVCVIAAYLYVGRIPSKAFVWSLSFIAGGTLGNLFDRAMYGVVRDFLHFFVVIGGKQHSWNNFNIADVSICLGVGLWILVEFRSGKKG